MGTDGAPAVEVAGALGALEELEEEHEIVLVGDREILEAELARHEGVPRSRLSVHHAADRVLPGEKAASVVRKKPESSIVVALRLEREGHVDAVVSAGSTGAIMAASLLILRALEGVDRPAVGTMLPTAGAPVLLLDAGANVDCKPLHLKQFAHLGNIYAQDLMGVDRPRIGLLNIGEEPEKGDERALETYQLLSSDSSLNFVGNIEGREIIRGGCDVLVADGFVGNVLLKFYESVAQFMIGLLEGAIRDAKITLDLDRLFGVLDYSEYGGAPLLGVNGVSIVCHGGSPPKAIRNAIGVAAQAVRSDTVARIARELAALKTAREAE